MVIGNFKPQASRPTSLKQLLAIGLDEALTALEECFYDLTDEQAWTHVMSGRHNITTLVMHILENADVHTCQYQTGDLVLEHEKRFDVWAQGEPDAPERKQGLPSVATMRERIRKLRAAALSGLESAGDADLLGPRCAADTPWWTEHHRTAADAAARVIWHIMVHVRQIWAMRGALGAIGEKGWPQQHYH